MQQSPSLPGFAVPRLARLIRESVDRMHLDLSGVRVLTEAATGAYVVTPVIAALAGADVTAVTQASRYGSVADVTRATRELAEGFGVSERIAIQSNRTEADFATADLVTNSGHLRPIVGDFARAMRPGSALSLMFETWEIQAGRTDLDLQVLLDRGVRVAGTNERHPHVDVFSYLGGMAVALLCDSGVPAYNSRIAVLCDNDFRGYIVAGLRAAGSTVYDVPSLAEIGDVQLDAIVVARTPTGDSVLTGEDVRILASQPGTIVIQYWGDLDRAALSGVAVPVWPATAPAPGHMAVLPSRVGPDAIVRLQAGGLKVGELLLRAPQEITADDLEYIDELD